MGNNNSSLNTEHVSTDQQNISTFSFQPTPNCSVDTSIECKYTTPSQRVQHITLEKGGCIDEGAYDQTQNVLLCQDHHPNEFIGAVVYAFANHFPLKLRPQQFYLLISQAISIHVSQHAESLRKHFVAHDGQKVLKVICDEFVKGQSNNWESVVHEKPDSFMKQIEANISETAKHALTESMFSNTSKVESIAMCMTVMDICKNYFTYKCSTRCGFPKITLDGTVEDWECLLDKTTQLLALCMPEFSQKWSSSLIPVLHCIVDTRKNGTVDTAFWNSFCKRGGTKGSGSYSWYNGWMNVFFPYIQAKDEFKINPYCVPYRDDIGYVKEGLHECYYGLFDHKESGVEGPDCADFPCGRCETPVVWEYHGETIPLKFISGFFGVQQHPETREVSPFISWCIVQD